MGLLEVSNGSSRMNSGWREERGSREIGVLVGALLEEGFPPTSWVHLHDAWLWGPGVEVGGIGFGLPKRWGPVAGWEMVLLWSHTNLKAKSPRGEPGMLVSYSALLEQPQKHLQPPKAQALSHDYTLTLTWRQLVGPSGWWSATLSSGALPEFPTGVRPSTRGYIQRNQRQGAHQPQSLTVLKSRDNGRHNDVKRGM